MSTEPRVLAGRYRVDELIGHGGMAKVYRGRDLTLGRDVAIKILDPELARDTAFRTRFRLEAQAASRMSHPSIVRVYDAGDSSSNAPTNGSGTPSDADPPYIVMELISGTLLKDIIASGPVPVADAVRYVDGILEALDYSHRAGVVHRDIKPGNVMVTDKGQVKVMDFGIARAVSDSSSTVAETTQILGTAAYFSPEQAKGEPVDARADLYSTGVVLYELLTGRQPFRGESPVAVAYQHVSETPVPPTEVNEEAPGALDPIVLRALAKDPYQRFPDAAHFRSALDAAVTGNAPTRKEIGALTSELYGPSPRQAQETARSLRQLSTDTTMARTQSGPPVAWIWAGVALLAVLLASVLFWVVTISMRPAEVPDTSRMVPDLVNVSSERAQEDLAKLDLTATITVEPSSDTAEGNVIRTDPRAGVAVEEGDTITLYVSSGEEKVVVPTLEGMSLVDAKKALTSAGLELGTVIQRNDKALRADTVISASEKADAEVPPDTVVNLVVASGKVTLTDLVGWTVDAATANLTDLGLTATPVESADCPATDPATVHSMSVAPGDVPVGSTVELRFCTGE
ncbi:MULTISPECIES: Stk1 family PASTA domain-containing Ser/Thr kinase [unclassified Microbacterium]|uniref:Stk1 family PASTA domain-containing Ser/Thr kinase n=1 Tax=unclassified Microbacterium TaxID=2609290 RepID=UPI000EA8F7DA|nr:MULTISPECIES: Stk1 family PASTA domain-containing Ser/Thr kinase [unclassified Microbacterium]MBT2484089.1 Stk1 family PASTA domain-containing Ser/Thr kinase [Microbacterium sp. ISL-108]RKN67037.1 Stk1 family PASTA domain-containing Ser/Thr kinase [Microbacterium sp. CGR2]